jgi:spore germination cell wall hydrolase CwlJ-like protein
MRYVLALVLLLLTISGDSSEHRGPEDCLALNVYHEARGESELGQIAVAQVTMNRVFERNPKWGYTVCEVVYAKDQFSWTTPNPRVTDWVAYNKALVIAKKVIRGGYDYDVTLGSTYFHAADISPCWLTDVKKSVRIDNHIFYQPLDKKSGTCYED